MEKVSNMLSKAIRIISWYLLPDKTKKYCGYLKGMNYGGLPKSRK